MIRIISLLIALSIFLIQPMLVYNNFGANFLSHWHMKGLGNGWVIEGDGYAIYDMAADNNFLYLVGTDSSLDQWRIEKRRLSDGSLDQSFGTNGVILTNKSAFGNAAAYGIAMDNEYMYIVGYSKGYPGPCGKIEKRRLSDGSLVWSQSDGICMAIYYSIAIDNNYLYVAGGTWSTYYSRLAYARLEKRRLSDGGLVYGFANSGKLEYEWWSPGYNAFNRVINDSSYLYLVGETGFFTVRKGTLMKVDINTGKKVYSEVGGTGGRVGPLYDLVMRDEYLYLAGYENLGSGDFQWVIWRVEKSSGSCAFGFGGDWTCIAESNPSGRYDVAQAITIDGDYLYVAGYDSNNSKGDTQWRIERRHLANGSLDTAFGEGGSITVNPREGENESAFAIIKKQNCIYVGGTPSWRLQAFYVNYLVYLPLVTKGQ